MSIEQQLLDIHMGLNRMIVTLDKIHDLQLKDSAQLSQRVDEILNTQEVLSERMDKRKIRMEVDPVLNPEILAIADRITSNQFTLREYKEYTPDGFVASDRLIGSTLIHNGYRKRQMRDGDRRKWVYERTDQRPIVPAPAPVQERPVVRIKTPEEIRQIPRRDTGSMPV